METDNSDLFTIDDIYFKDCFTEVEEGINAEFNKATVKCFDSSNNAFSMDCDGNLVVNSIVTRVGNQNIDESTIVDLIYPVGSIYLSVNSTNPSSLFGGTWEAWGTGRVPVSVDTSDSDFNTVEKTGGSKLLQAHTHTGTTSTSGAHTHGIPWDGYKIGSGSYFKYVAVGDGSNVNVYTTSSGSHTHTFTTASSGGGSSQNLPPYITCYMWKRVA